MKTLYFEGAGMDYKSELSDIGNYRIRTAFLDNKGKAIYLELGGHDFNEKKGIVWKSHIDHVFYIREDGEEKNLRLENTMEGYKRAELTKWINSNFDCDFDDVVILPGLAGYRVFRDGEGHNFGDEFLFDAELTARRESIHDYFYQIEKAEGKQYPNFSLWVDSIDKHELHLMRHFNGYNRHWSIRTDTDNWQESISETKLGKYAC